MSFPWNLMIFPQSLHRILVLSLAQSWQSMGFAETNLNSDSGPSCPHLKRRKRMRIACECVSMWGCECCVSGRRKYRLHCIDFSPAIWSSWFVKSEYGDDDELSAIKLLLWILILLRLLSSVYPDPATHPSIEDCSRPISDIFDQGSSCIQNLLCMWTRKQMSDDYLRAPSEKYPAYMWLASASTPRSIISGFCLYVFVRLPCLHTRWMPLMGSYSSCEWTIYSRYPLSTLS